MAAITLTTATSDSVSATTGRTNRGPFAIMTILFFMWGFMTVWNDVLIPRFKDAFRCNASAWACRVLAPARPWPWAPMLSR